MKLETHSFVLRLLAAAAAAALFCSAGRAQEVHLRWKTIPEATRYEVEVTQNEKPVLSEFTEKADGLWQAQLPAGMYTFRLRAYDWAGRPGQWSPAKPFTVMPAAPLSESPRDGAMPTRSVKMTTTLRWQKIEGIEKYRLEIFSHDKQTRTVKIVSGNEMRFVTPAMGSKFTWRVVALLPDPTRKPASTNTPPNFLESAPSKWSAFQVAKSDDFDDGSPREDRYISLTPRFSQWVLNSADPGNSATGKFVSVFTPGAAASISFPFTRRFSTFFNFTGTRVSFSPPSGTTISPRDQIGTEEELGFAWRRIIFQGLRLSLSGGLQQEMFVQSLDESSYTINMVGLWFIRARAAFELFRFATHWHVGLDGSFSAQFSKTTDVVTFANGFIYNGKATLLWDLGETALIGSVYATAAEATSTAGTQNRLELGTELEVQFRF